MELIVKTYRKDDQLPELPGQVIFHSAPFFQLCACSPVLSPYLFVCYRNEFVVGKMLVLLVRNRKLIPRSLFSSCLSLGEPELFVPREELNEVFDCLLKEAINVLNRSCFYMEYKSIWRDSMFGYKVFRQNGFIPLDRIYIQNNFKKPRNVLKQMSESKQRQAIRGRMRGTIITEASTIEEVREWFDIAHKVYAQRLLKHLPKFAFYEFFFNELIKQNFGTLFLSRNSEGKIIGGMLCLFSGDVMYEWYSGSSYKFYRDQYPGVLLTYHALDYCQQKGYTYFNFKDSLPPFYPSSILDFKLQFGGKQRNSKRWYRMRWNWLNNIFAKLYV